MYSTRLYGTIVYFWFILGWMVLLDVFLTEDAVSGFKDKSILTFSVRLKD